MKSSRRRSPPRGEARSGSARPTPAPTHRPMESARHADAALPPRADGEEPATASGSEEDGADDGDMQWEESHPKATKYGCRSWTSDETPACELCGRGWTTLRRRHHCRGCGALVCADCSQTRERAGDSMRLKRVCTRCRDVSSAAEVLVDHAVRGGAEAANGEPRGSRAAAAAGSRPAGAAWKCGGWAAAARPGPGT